MHSSISSSRAPTTAHVVVLLLACALVCGLIEGGTACGFGRLSRMEHRREAEYRRAVAMHRGEHSSSVLVAGNSLLLEGVDFPRLQQEAGPGLDLQRTVVEGTFYLDWYYGLRRMFAEGAQPDAVVLVLNPTQLTSGSVGGDYTAHFLVDRSDVLRFAEESGADRNRMSSIALANLSFFYGARAEIRSWVLGQILPDLPSLSRNFHSPPRIPDSEGLREVAQQRLNRLRQLCQDHKAELVFVIPPSNEDAGTAAVSQAAATLGVPTLVPIAPGMLPLSDYSDRFHLNAQGASKFTRALAAALKQALSAAQDHDQSAALDSGIHSFTEQTRGPLAGSSSGDADPALHESGN